MHRLMSSRWVFFSAVLSALIASTAGQPQAEKTPIVAIGPQQGTVRWADPVSDKELGSGALLNIKVDRFSVPYTNLMVMTQKLAASGIPVHSHRWEDEVIYVIKGRGFAVVNQAQTAVPIETGSVLYIPLGTWHGLRNADPNEPMDALLVTTPVKPDGLGDYFRFANVEPGHPPLNLPEEEFLRLVKKYGMDVPTPN
jgi:quercetin dioxygenase-like cupin family protein